MTSAPEDLLSIDHYVKKTFYKTASLMANSCKAIVILAGQPEQDCQLAWEFGKHLGLAFQVRNCHARCFYLWLLLLTGIP